MCTYSAIKSSGFLLVLSFGLLCITHVTAEPTASRDWTSTAGTKIQAVAGAVKQGSVHLKTSDGREIKVPLASLIEQDRLFLREHFKPVPPKNLPYPIGQASGPHRAGEGSSFFIYLPNSLREGRKAPVLVYTSAGGGNMQDVTAFSEGAELNGWIIVASVESKNGRSIQADFDTIKKCGAHLLNTLPVDENRDYDIGTGQ